MKRAIVSIIATLLFLAGCAHGPVQGVYPPETSAPEPATVVIGRRANALLGAGMFVKVTINGRYSYSLINGEQIEFNVDPGENWFGVMAPGSSRHHEIPIDCKAGESHYLLIKIHQWIPPTIETVRDRKLLSQTTLD